MSVELLLWSLFASSFLSSTLLPGSSEAVLTGLLIQGEIAPTLLLIVATIGNTLGGLTNVVIGRVIPELKPQKGLAWGRALIQRYGSVVLLLSWLPVVGDLLCLLAGWLRLPWWTTVVFICLGKLLRYLVLIMITLQTLFWWQ